MKYSKEIFKHLLLMLPGSLLISLVYLVDQYFCNLLSVNNLYAHTAIFHIPSNIQILGRLIGSIIIVIVSTKSILDKTKLLNQCLTGILLLLIMLSGIFVVFKGQYFKIFEIENNGSNNAYFLIMVVNASLSFFCTVFNFLLISNKKTKELLVSDISLFVLNLTGNIISYIALEEEFVFIGLAVSTGLSLMLCILIQDKFLNVFKLFKIESPITFYRDFKNIIKGESLVTILTMISIPLLHISINKFSSIQLTSSFNVAYRMIHFLFMPIILLRLIGIRFLGESLNDYEIYKSKDRAILNICASFSFFYFLVFCFSNEKSISLFFDNLASSNYIFIKYSLLSLVPFTWNFYFMIIKRVENDFSSIAFAGFVKVLYLLAISIYLQYSRTQNPIILSFYLFILPECVYFVFVAFKKIKVRLAVISCMLFVFVSNQGYASTLRAGVSYDVNNINVYETKNNSENLINSLVHKQLVSIGYNNVIMPSIASSWIIKKNEIKFKIKRGITHSGKRGVQCRDVKYSIISSKSRLSIVKEFIKNIKDIECPSKFDIKIRFKRDRADLLDILSFQHFTILYEGQKNMNIGFGPYYFDQKKKSLVLKKNSYFKLNKSFTKIKFYTDSQTNLVKMFKKNKLDILLLNDVESFSNEGNHIVNNYFDRLHFIIRNKKVSNNDKIKCVSNLIKIERKKYLSQTNREDFKLTNSILPNDQVGKMELNAQDCSKFGNVNILVLKNNYDQRFVRYLVNKYKKLKLIEITLIDFFRKLNNFKFDVHLGSFGLSQIDTINFMFYYSSGSIVIPPLGHRLELDQIVLDAPYLKSNLDFIQTVKSVESKLSNSNIFTPLFFTKSSYLINRCLEFEDKELESFIASELEKVKLKSGCK